MERSPDWQQFVLDRDEGVGPKGVGASEGAQLLFGLGVARSEEYNTRDCEVS